MGKGWAPRLESANAYVWEQYTHFSFQFYSAYITGHITLVAPQMFKYDEHGLMYYSISTASKGFAHFSAKIIYD